MTPRERVIASLNHQEPDILPLDLGSTLITGIHVSSLHKIKVALGLIKPNEPVKVFDPFQMLGEVDNELRTVLGIDTICLPAPKNFFGFKNERWKPWIFFDGTPLLVPEKFNTLPDALGDIYQYPEGDTSASPSGKMPGGGFYHDAVIRQKPIRGDQDLRVEDQIAEYQPLTEEDLAYYEREARRLYEETDYAVVFGGVPGTNLGDIALVPGPTMKEPAGIRDVEEWYVSLVTRKEYLSEVFSRMSEIGLRNLERFHQAVGSRIQVIVLSGTDFGSQSCPFVSPILYRELFKPFHQKMNQWIHEHTKWKVFIHTCGSIWDLLPDLQEAGFDILNPVQISAAKMVPSALKRDFGKQFTFWGGGINTQTTLPFGTAQEVKEEARALIESFQPDGGFVFAAVHNIQANIPVENLLALFEALNEYR
ncbi:MAG TPA: uroporphyrinogen decarboxylase family protein [Atribacteraceae bacterium]|nr:uroporphyrinogen decarboxylase family protein [Atribacteraceae bacterium]